MRRAGLLVGLSVAVACGGEDAPDRQAYVDEAVVWIREDDDEVEVTDAQAACLAEAIVDAVGVDQLDDAGVSPEDLRSMGTLSDVGIELSSSSVEDLSGRISGCDIDVSGTFIDAMTAQLSSIELSPESTSCLSDGFSAGFAATFAQSIAADSEAAAGELFEQLGFELLGGCPGALTEVLVAGIEAGGLELSPEAEQCIATEIEQGGSDLVAEFVAAGEDQAAAERLGVRIVTPCAHLIQG